MPGLLAGQPSSKLYSVLPKGQGRWECVGTHFLVNDSKMICSLRGPSQSYFNFLVLHLRHCSFDSYLQSKAMFFLGIGGLEMD